MVSPIGTKQMIVQPDTLQRLKYAKMYFACNSLGETVDVLLNKADIPAVDELMRRRRG